MKTKSLMAAALLLSVTSFTQTSTSKNEHATSISSKTKSSGSIETKGPDQGEKRKVEKELAKQKQVTKEVLKSTANDVSENAQNDHGVTVNTTAHTAVKTDNETKGSAVNGVASSNSQASVNTEVGFNTGTTVSTKQVNAVGKEVAAEQKVVVKEVKVAAVKSASQVKAKVKPSTVRPNVKAHVQSSTGLGIK